MSKVIIKINDPNPKPETIVKHKSFKTFVNDYYKYHTPSGFRKLMRTDIKKLVLIVIIVVLLLLLFLGEL